MTLIQADLLKWLRDNQWLVQNGYMPKAHAVIGDPPYGLEFMGKEWDKPRASGEIIRDPVSLKGFQNGNGGNPYTRSRIRYGVSNDYQAWVTEWATLLLDFVYPGAVLALFGGTRTYHRLAAGLEDAGWEVFDCMMYLYGSGFPKAADIGKLIDQREGAEREVVCRNPNHRLISGVEYEGIYQGGNTGASMLTAPATDAAKRWDGYKTALKPAYEPIVLCRAPRGSTTYAALAQQYGTGALNIDGARIGTEEHSYRSTTVVGAGRERAVNVVDRGDGKTLDGRDLKSVLARQQRYRDSRFETSVAGRYPANLALDEAAARLLDDMSGELTSGGRSHVSGDSNISTQRGIYSNAGGKRASDYHLDPDSGGASRFFYTAKAAAWEREAGLADFNPQIVNDGRDTPIDNAYQRGETKRRNTHPTVKPIQLITWLATLLLPPPLDVPRRVLVPFAGSGSEMIGCQFAGWDEVVGIEREAEYCAINEARRRWWAKFKTYEQAEMAYRPVIQITDDFSDLPLFAAQE